MKLERLTSTYNELSSLEKKVVEYLTNYPEEVIRMTTRELAEKLYISKTTVINLAKKLGFDGYTELKYYLKNHVGEKEETVGESEKFAFRNVLDALEEEVSKTLSIQQEETVKEIADILTTSKTVYVVSRGASKPFGSYLSSRLAMLKIRCIFVDDFNLIDNLSHNIETDEAVLVISLSGNTKRILDISRAAHIRGSKVISLTSFSDSKVQQNADISMYCYAKTSETVYNDLISRVGIHLLIQIILSYTQYVVEKRREENDNTVK